MAEKKSFKRTLKRNTLNIILVLLVLAVLVGAAVLLLNVFHVFDKPPKEAQEPSVPALEDVLIPDDTIPDPEQAEPSDALQQQETVKREEAHTYGSVKVYFDSDSLLETISQTHGVALTLPGGEALPRVDIQGISGSYASLSQAEAEQLAAGILQSYYVDAPATDQVTVKEDKTLERAFIVETAAFGDAPAVRARVRFFQAGQTLWYVTLLQAADAQENEVLTTVFETAELP